MMDFLFEVNTMLKYITVFLSVEDAPVIVLYLEGGGVTGDTVRGGLGPWHWHRLL